MGETMPETMLDFMPAPVAALSKLMGYKPKKGAEILHQYATAIPIGTALAQSWNRKFAFICGDIVGDEMERFGVHLWRAPALNILPPTASGIAAAGGDLVMPGGSGGMPLGCYALPNFSKDKELSL